MSVSEDRAGEIDDRPPEEEAELIALFLRLSAGDRSAVLGMAESMLEVADYRAKGDGP